MQPIHTDRTIRCGALAPTVAPAPLAPAALLRNR